MSKPQRIQLSRQKGFKLGPNARSVARPSYFGNPYRVGDVYLDAPLLPFPLPSARTWEGPVGSSEAEMNAVKCADAKLAVEWFRRWVPYLDSDKLALLRGRDLACWCRLGDWCHADVLLELANSEDC